MGRIQVLLRGSDWCGWCVKLEEEVFSQEDFTKFAKKNLVCVLLDFPNHKEINGKLKKQNYDLAEKFEIKGFPSVLLINSEGKLVVRTGYRKGGPKEYVKFLKESIKNYEKLLPPKKEKVKPSKKETKNEFRTWTSIDGKTIDAKLLNVNKTSVQFETKKGRKTVISRDKLSEDDNKYLDGLK